MKPIFTLPLCDHALVHSPLKRLLINALLFCGPLLFCLPVIAEEKNETCRQNFTFGTPTTGTESMRVNLYLLNTQNNSTILADGVLAEYNHLYNDSVTLEDAYKLTNIRENLGLSRYTSTLAVERRPIISLDDTLYFKLWKTTQRHYQLEFIAINLYRPGMQAFLQDSYLGTNTTLSLTGTTKINFSINANKLSSDIRRFKLIYKTIIAQSPLPVTFTNIQAQQVNNKVSIDWKVENEINIARYEVERSGYGSDFKLLNSLGVIGVNNSFNSYKSLDHSPVAGNNFYRIKSVDKDGVEKYSTTVKVVANKTEKGTISIFPNPITGNKINLQFTDQQPGVYQVRLYNNNGQMVYSTKLTVNSNHISQSIYPSQGLRGGIYQLEIVKPDNTTTNMKAMMQ